MHYDELTGAGAAAAGVGLAAAISAFVWLRRRLDPMLAPGVIGYFGVALLLAVCAFVLGASGGIFYACSADDANERCGLYGVFGTGPMLAGLVLLLYALRWTVRGLRAPRD